MFCGVCSIRLLQSCRNRYALCLLNELPISIAGLVESQNVAYSENTKTLLIEGSIFNAAKIRQQSRKLGLRTDRSARYEKSLKNTYLIKIILGFLFLYRIYLEQH